VTEFQYICEPDQALGLLVSGSYSPAPLGEGSCSISVPSLWDLWWKKWH